MEDGVDKPSKQPPQYLYPLVNHPADTPQVNSPFAAILSYELTHSIPPGWINHSISASSPTGTWQSLETGRIPLDSTFFTYFSLDLHSPTLWSTFYLTKALPSNPSLPASVPPLPKIDAEQLFWNMMSASRPFDPWMYPALLALKKSNQYILAALSNTVIFPESHPYAHPAPEEDIRRIFDVFVSSAHVGLRKPDPAIYALAMERLNEHAQEKGRGRVEAGDVFFFDDIGENLKGARKAGMRTFKVNLGRTFEAVDELERVTGLELAGGHPRVPVEVKAEAVGKAKL
ncbi:putative epoxide hydrolase 2 [Glarea lozoyensis 74030]|uniref:Putative epoxide hydrolase 2 n=1 Tax=Glarea lozoyensis (strain ATCC 74030 / MF5533) TaxID=1104152 RepID=H0EN49_GLAL7|nr:putative epoxide hydrolase 2 [Glarea lozoyensis 74030]